MKYTFKNHAVVFKIKKIGSYFWFQEKEEGSFGHKLFPSRAKCITAMQKYSKRHYGEKAV